MLPLSPNAVREAACQKAVLGKMCDVEAASHRLQRVLGIRDADPWPNPPISATLSPLLFGLVPMNGVRLRAALYMCKNFAVDMNRKSESKDFLDKRILFKGGATESAAAITPGIDEDNLEDQRIKHGKEYTPDTAMTKVENGVPAMIFTTATDDSLRYSDDEDDHFPRTARGSSQSNHVGEMYDQTHGIALRFPPRVSSLPTFVSNNTAVATDLKRKYLEDKASSGNPAKSAKIAIHVDENANVVKNADVEDTTAIARTVLNDGTAVSNDGPMGTTTLARANPNSTTTSITANDAANEDRENMRQAGKLSTKNLRRKFSVPDPVKMPGTFTGAICHQKEFSASPILTLTLMDTPSPPPPPKRRPIASGSKFILHFEVGLDGVEALCQGQFTIDQSSHWKDNIHAKRLGKGEKVDAGVQEPNQIIKGNGEGRWLFFGVRFKQTGKDERKGKGGKWACFGVPTEACSHIASNSELARYGGGFDGQGNIVPPYSAKVQRMQSRFSTGGIACMDLWQGADEWRGGVWAEVKHAMARNGLLVSFLYSAERIEAVEMRREGMVEVEANRPNYGADEKYA